MFTDTVCYNTILEGKNPKQIFQKPKAFLMISKHVHVPYTLYISRKFENSIFSKLRRKSNYNYWRFEPNTYNT